MQNRMHCPRRGGVGRPTECHQHDRRSNELLHRSLRFVGLPNMRPHPLSNNPSRWIGAKRCVATFRSCSPQRLLNVRNGSTADIRHQSVPTLDPPEAGSSRLSLGNRRLIAA